MHVLQTPAVRRLFIILVKRALKVIEKRSWHSIKLNSTMFEYFKTKSSKEIAKSPSKSEINEISEDESEMVAEVEENERFSIKHKTWKSEFLLPSDPKR